MLPAISKQVLPGWNFKSKHHGSSKKTERTDLRGSLAKSYSTSMTLPSQAQSGSHFSALVILNYLSKFIFSIEPSLFYKELKLQIPGYQFKDEKHKTTGLFCRIRMKLQFKLGCHTCSAQLRGKEERKPLCWALLNHGSVLITMTPFKPLAKLPNKPPFVTWVSSKKQIKKRPVSDCCSRICQL